MTIFSKPYNDYPLYHLPYMELIRDYKIIFGLSNLDYRYAHPSIFQNISAMQYNSLMKLDSFVFYTPLLTVLSLVFIFKKLFTTKNIFIYFISSLVLVFYMIHASRYGSLGNDYPVHILGIISLIIYFELINTNSADHQKVTFLIFLVLLTIFSKFSMIFFCLIPFYILYKKKMLKLTLLNFNYLFIILISSIFFLKNYINSSCLVFPVTFTCINSDWSISKYNFGSPETVSIESKVNVKDFIDSDHFNNPLVLENIKEKIFTNKNYLKDYKKLNDFNKNVFLKYFLQKDYLKLHNWFPNYLKGPDFREKFIKNAVVLNICFLVLILLITSNKKLIFHKNLPLSTFLIKNNFIIAFTIFNFLFWLFSFPILRYGISYVLIFCCLPTIFLFRNLNLVKNDYLNKYLKLILFVSFCYFLISNFSRIYNNVYNLKFFEKSRLNSIILITNPEYENVLVNDFVIKYPISSTCMATPQFCTVFAKSMAKSGKKISKNKYGYIVVK